MGTHLAKVRDDEIDTRVFQTLGVMAVGDRQRAADANDRELRLDACGADVLQMLDTEKVRSGEEGQGELRRDVDGVRVQVVEQRKEDLVPETQRWGGSL